MQSLGEYMSNFPGGINELLQPAKTSQGLLSGFDGFDELTDGFHETEIFTVGALPGMGKTSLLLGISENIARRGGTVVVFSQEMSKRSLFNRILCQNAGISVNRFRRGDINRDERLRIVQAANYLNELPLEIDDTTGLTVPAVSMKLKREHDRKRISLYGIDFVQLMRAVDSKKGSENDRLTEICIGLQNLCKETGIPLLLLSQLSRVDKSKKDKRPTLDSLRGTGMLEVVSNVVAFIHREEVFDKTDDQHKNKAELIIAKNREGETKTLLMGFRGFLAKFEDKPI